MEILRLNFNKDENNKTVLSDLENQDKLFQYVFPVIEQNEGWGSGDLTRERFLQNPSKYQDVIDGSVWKNVHILLVDNNPVGLLEFGKTSLDEDKERHRILNTLISGTQLESFNRAINKETPHEKLSEMHTFLKTHPIYTAVGVVLKPSLQGKHTGYSNILYEIIKDGLVFGWTSNPVVVRKRHTTFAHTLYFPSYGEFPNSIEEWAVCMYVYAYVVSHDKKDYDGLEFGTMYSPYFVEDRGETYITLAQEMQDKRKISSFDSQRIKYILGRHSCAGAIVSWN